MMMSYRLWKTEKSSIVRRTESVSMIHHGQSVVDEFHSSGPDTETLLLPYLANAVKSEMVTWYGSKV